MHRESRDRREPRKWTMYALDGAGEDASTLYVMHDEYSVLVGAHEVPAPLLQIAYDRDAVVWSVHPPIGEVIDE